VIKARARINEMNQKKHTTWNESNEVKQHPQHKIGGVYLSREECFSRPPSSITCKTLILESEI
jgi:hypothetical protein